MERVSFLRSLHEGFAQQGRIARRRIENGRRNRRVLEGRPLTFIGVLTGSIVLMADLIRMIDVPMRVGVLQASSYRGATTTRRPGDQFRS
jgi:hypoxanthine phosphoribosyltransferase